MLFFPLFASRMEISAELHLRFQLRRTATRRNYRSSESAKRSSRLPKRCAALCIRDIIDSRNSVFSNVYINRRSIRFYPTIQFFPINVLSLLDKSRMIFLVRFSTFEVRMDSLEESNDRVKLLTFCADFPSQHPDTKDGPWTIFLNRVR